MKRPYQKYKHRSDKTKTTNNTWCSIYSGWGGQWQIGHHKKQQHSGKNNKQINNDFQTTLPMAPLPSARVVWKSVLFVAFCFCYLFKCCCLFGMIDLFELLAWAALRRSAPFSLRWAVLRRAALRCNLLSLRWAGLRCAAPRCAALHFIWCTGSDSLEPWA